MRINGFSGMDIDSMVKSLMTVQRVPLDKMNQQKQTLQWTRDNYREFNSQLVNFKNKLSDFGKQSTTNTQVSTVSGNTTAVKAEANASASVEPMEVIVNKLATKSTASSTAELTAGTAATTLKTTLSQITGAGSSDNYKMKINNKEIDVSSSDTIEAVIIKINSSGAGVTASFDQISGKFSVLAKEYGAAANVNIESGAATATSGDLSGLLKLSVTNAVDGQVTIKNAAYPSGRTFDTSDNTLNVNGIKLTMLQATGTSGSSIVNTQSDPTKALDSVKAFVNLYNELVDKINTKTTEARYKNFTPLSDEQKKEMKESEIKQWEDKAKSGLLKGDSILTSAASNMRSTVVSYLGDLSSVGITTGLYHENGKLKIDEEKLKNALSTDPQKVLNIFQGSSADPSKKGLFADLSKQVNGTLDQMVSKVGTSKFDTAVTGVFKQESMIGRQIKDYDKRISSMTVRMNAMETRYYKQFSAMEEAMSKMQAQSSSLTNSLG
ncbi:flagellar filament capping protein FliD [Saccharibacillus brassicae]|uniref:Flagellar hook-associated protein 2 n=1 Tax=Saccharibacillus brassicae TaxID=2583377 RepID=A0A4Y6UT16_SACBS|nr:flagellar filament capping protein FliD [Saccharibacillus brassicae]QDH20843.1 flagellar capping protein [Saccharibacillus brassicae]